MQSNPVTKPVLKQNEPTKSILVPSRVISRPDELQGGEETEITAQISIPQEGGWGWVVVIAAFWSIFILDGVAITFGSILGDISDDLNVSDSLVALINSVAIAIYLIAGPLASAFINRFGFRACSMCGSIICSFSLFCSYFTSTYGPLCVFYGAFAGFGYCFINMSSSLVVGFYFERLRPLALALATTGSSFGVMVMFPTNTFLVKLGGWRVTTLLHSGLFSLVFFLGMTFRPILSLTVMKTSDDPTRTVTYLPSLSTATLRQTASKSTRVEGLVPTATERLFSAISNSNFPTAAAVVDEGTFGSRNLSNPSTLPGPSTSPASKLTIRAHSPQGGISRQQLKQVQSIISKTSMLDKTKMNVEVHVEQPVKRGCWARLCHWDSHVPQSRPMYRDDAFYDGKLETLPAYKKSVMDTSEDNRTGLEYQLAVSRALTNIDLLEQRGLFTTAARRILATMMDPKLLKRRSFIFLSTSGFLTYLGYLVPYVFLQDRNASANIKPEHCALFVSVIGFSNALGRLTLGALACKIDALKIFVISCLIAGICTMASNLSFNLYYQYAYCATFGFFIASIACLRSMVIVNLYGLDKLTNATGMILMFQGLGSLISTPVASVFKNTFGYSIAFYVAGFFITLSGLCLLPVKSMVEKEN